MRSDGCCSPVAFGIRFSGSFELGPVREWGSQHGTFGNGFHFTSPDGHFYGPGERPGRYRRPAVSGGRPD